MKNSAMVSIDTAFLTDTFISTVVESSAPVYKQ